MGKQQYLDDEDDKIQGSRAEVQKRARTRD
jgi:hypothetical protein